MPNSSTIIGSSRRGGPTFKFYWVENGQITAIKRRDESIPNVHAGLLFSFIGEAFPHFNCGVYAVKFLDENDLVDLKSNDPVCFNADSGDMQINVYIFSSIEEAARTVCPPTSGSTPKPPMFGSPMSQSSSTQVSLPGPAVPTPETQNNVTVSQPDVAVSPQPEDQTAQGEIVDCGSTQSAPKCKASNNSTKQSPQQEAGDSGVGHENIVCDGCNASIPTHRYKCIQCPDFDLCANCEANGCHPEHLMVRVPLHFVRVNGAAHRDILRRMISVISREFPEVVIDLGKQLKDVLKLFGIEVDHIGERKHCDGRRRGNKGRRCPFSSADRDSDLAQNPLLKRYYRLRDELLANARGTQSQPSDPTSSAAPTTSPQSSAHAPTAPVSSTPATAPSTTAPANPTNAPANPTTAPANPTTAPANPTTAPANSTTAPATSTTAPASGVAPNPIPTPAAALALVAESAPTLDRHAPVSSLVDFALEVVPMEEDSHRPGEWLMVDSDGAAAVTVPTPSPPAAQTVPQVPFLHTDIQVNFALGELAAMGYRIDDPLLVNVVENCKGDLTRIVDCLHG